MCLSCLLSLKISIFKCKAWRAINSDSILIALYTPLGSYHMECARHGIAMIGRHRWCSHYLLNGALMWCGMCIIVPCVRFPFFFFPPEVFEIEIEGCVRERKYSIFRITEEEEEEEQERERERKTKSSIVESYQSLSQSYLPYNKPIF